ncbi:GNAT family N-acetyltransferase [Labrys wisconsinensis]|uniref:Diamine N-acetyltransferase n=1 Tax=Labrys wisconsinensis TaxID=425677 RepID=A0ABU0J3M3_9HYPH|nr:GNAT family N-acetyltransferase [Labrys wisconsinensis]MDQ0468860.1 diamine N-acetyltransferase [Labrys wisconsinensis]
MPLAIRPARPEDAQTVLTLIRGLADYEKLLHEVEATEADIAASLFGPNPRVFCDIAEWDGAAAGFALWFYNYSTFLGRHGLYLEDLFVRPEFRAHGIGKALLAHLARRCLAEGLGRLEWAVLDWNEPAIGFYKRQGAVMRDEWTGCRLSGEALTRLAQG